MDTPKLSETQDVTLTEVLEHLRDNFYGFAQDAVLAMIGAACEQAREVEQALADALKAKGEAAKRDREMAYFVLLLRDWTIPKLLEDYDPEVVASAKKRVDAVWAETHTAPPPVSEPAPKPVVDLDALEKEIQTIIGSYPDNTCIGECYQDMKDEITDAFAKHKEGGK